MNLDKCVAFSEGEQTRLPFPDHGSRATAILEVIHPDL